jgi:hypothetical protein
VLNGCFYKVCHLLCDRNLPSSFPKFVRPWHTVKQRKFILTISLMMEASTSETLVNFYQTTPDYTAQQPRRQPSSYSPPWEPQILHKYISLHGVHKFVFSIIRITQSSLRYIIWNDTSLISTHSMNELYSVLKLVNKRFFWHFKGTFSTPQQDVGQRNAIRFLLVNIIQTSLYLASMQIFVYLSKTEKNMENLKGHLNKLTHVFQHLTPQHWQQT